MRNPYRILPIALCAAALAACAGGGLPTNAHPDGWTQKAGSANVWVSPSVPGATYEVAKKPFDGENKSFAESMTLDMVLKRHAKLQKTVAFAPCPGEAGLQTYAAGASTISVAFAVYDGNAFTATYSRPKGTPDDPAVTDAMRKSVCTAGA